MRLAARGADYYGPFVLYSALIDPGAAIIRE
jgi:hypothetical protein